MAASKPDRWLQVALYSQIVLLVYLEVIEWIDLFPWNDVRGGNGQEAFDIGLGIVMLGLIAGTWKHWRPALWLSTAVCAVWLWLQVHTFWVSHVAGASPDWKHVWTRWFSQTIQVLPVVGDHLPPDACHFVLQLLIVAALVSCLGARLSLREQHR